MRVLCPNRGCTALHDVDEDDCPLPPNVNESARKQVEEERKRWSKERGKLEEEDDLVKIDNRRAFYGHTWGMMVGFLFLAASSVGFLSLGPGKIHRIVGAVVLMAQVVLVVIVYLFSSVRLRAASMFR